MVRLAVLTVLVALVAPSAARAADVSVVNGILRYQATPGKISNVIFTETGAGIVQVTVGAGDTDGLNPLTGCTPGTPVVCGSVLAPVVSATIDAGDMSDRVTATYGDPANPSGLMNIPAVISGGDGNDAIDGGARGDTIDGGAGDDDLNGFAGNDSIRGGDGNDVITPNVGADAISGGDGIDTVEYSSRTSPVFSLDGIANDGDFAGDSNGDLIGADVENITSFSATGIATLIGDGRANHLVVSGGRGDLTGGDGADVLEGGSFDDSFHARDGAPDTIICNGGVDTVEADTQDTVSPTCEVVSIVATPGGAFDDRPPLIAWVTPSANASLGANDPTQLLVQASDDRGLTRIQFFDDDRLVCDLTAEPFVCPYAPRGADVGRNTLIAVASDGAGQSTSIIRAITVRRFSTPSLSLKLTPSRDRKAPYKYLATGKVARPTAVAPSQGCSGTVTIKAKKGTKVVATHRAAVDRNCEFKITIKYRTRVASKLRLTAAFGGNDVLGERTAPSRNIRLG